MKLVTIKEVSKFLSVKESTLYSWVSKSSIPSHKINGLIRFDLDEIKEWVKESRQGQPIPNRELRRTPKDQDIDGIVKKAIEEITGNRYNSSIGKPGPRQGLRREVDDGTL